MSRLDYTEKMAKDYAKAMAKTVVIRSYEDGNSKDTRRKATRAEASLVERAIAAALIAIRSGSDESSAKATAEHFVLYGGGEAHINTYDSVFIPIDKLMQYA